MFQNLGDTLVEINVLTKTELQNALNRATTENGDLLTILKRDKIVSDINIAKAFAKMLNIPLFEKITENIANPDYIARAPFKFLRENSVIPCVENDKVFLVSANPQNFQALDELNLLFNGQASIATGPENIILDAINKFYPLEGTKEEMEEIEQKDLEGESLELSKIQEQDILGMGQEAPIIKLVNQILFQAYKSGASDIHIEPQEKEVRIRYRIDGIMHEALTPPKRLQSALISRVKIMSNLNIAEKRIPQDGRIQIKIADKPIDIRVSALPSAFGEKIVMRLLDKSKSFGKLSDLGLSEHDFKSMSSAISQPNGIILVSGPTGSGKTSTLYSILNKLNVAEVSIVTVEDPIEYQMKGITQVQVNDKVGLTFAAALRSILRQDPDIVMIGETRDQETAQIAIQASLTGHLVLSTIHTNSAPVTITRLIDMGIEPFLIASSVSLVIAQRLVRKLCPFCKQKFVPEKKLLTNLGLTEKDAASIAFYKAVGCSECGNNGYKGRIAIFEIMPMSNAIAKLTMEKSDASVIKATAIKEGMTTLAQDGVAKIKEGLTTIEEVLSVASSMETLDQ